MLALALAGCEGAGPGTPPGASPAIDASATAKQPPPPDAGAAAPDPARQAALAIGDTSDESPLRRAAFAPDPAFFSTLPPPGDGDWLSVHNEPAQSFERYRLAPGNRVNDRRKRLYLQPIGSAYQNRTIRVRHFQRFLAAYFGLEVVVLPARDAGDFARSAREAPWGLQLQTPAVFAALRAKLPSDAYGVIGITGIDLYPNDSFNFVFGQATFADRLGVLSINRFTDPKDGKSPSTAVIRKRALTLAAHEIGHMFGLPHCRYYQCVMNGSNGLSETDRSPLHLCPVCLRKLDYVARLKLLDRTRRLAKELAALGLPEQARWHRRRAKALGPKTK